MGKRERYASIAVLFLATVLSVYFLGRFLLSVYKVQSLTGFAINSRDLLSNLLVPTAVTSIVFSIIGLLTMAFLIFQIRARGIGRIFPFKGYIFAISIIFVIFFINYFITLFSYGNLVFNIVSFILQVMIYGVLLPYILVAQVSYIILLLKGDIKGVLI